MFDSITSLTERQLTNDIAHASVGRQEASGLNRQACLRNEVTDAPREINEFSLTL